jgi:hypothetical protein
MNECAKKKNIPDTYIDVCLPAGLPIISLKGLNEQEWDIGRHEEYN